jgi:hypothetical protein
VKPVILRWLNGRRSAALDAWCEFVDEKATMRLFVTRARSRLDSLALSAWCIWLAADFEFVRQGKVLGKFTARFRSRAAFTAFSSWCGAHREWMSIKGRMASVARKMANRDTLAGYNTWFKGVATRKRQQHLVKKFGLRMRLGTCSCFR